MGEVVVPSDEPGMEMEVRLETEEDQSKKIVRWENFLPQMVLRVLLVEADDSTRHVIAALLRKCSYKVAAVPDGLKAWETLKGKASEIDLILTEVELPSISGFALLTLIMEHDICKNIPVIMMSTHDSVSLSVKCILKGAADFLIKPVRRNELRNLWQHVWRTHEKKLETTPENNAASNQSSGSVASTQKNNGRPEKGSEAQGTSHLKSSSNLSDIEKVQNEDSTILSLEKQSVELNNETGDKSGTLLSPAAKCDKNFKSTDFGQEQGHDCAEKENQVEVLRAESSRENHNMDREIHECNNELVEPCRGAIDLIATFKNLPVKYDERCNLSGTGAKKFDFDPRLELSLRRDFPGSSPKQAIDEKLALNHSKASAFSWYSGCKFPSPSGSSAKAGGHNGNSHEASKLSINTVDTSRQHGGRNHSLENMATLAIGQSGQVEIQLTNSQLGPFPATGVASDNKPTVSEYVFPPMLQTQSYVHSTWSPKPNFPKESSPSPILASNSFQSNPEGHEQRFHCCDDATYTSRDKTANEKSNLDPATQHSSAVDQSTSNASCHDTENQSSKDDNNTSAHILACKIDGNASSAAVVESNTENYGDSGNHNKDGFRGADSHCPSRREAALTKFRMKRKERCYEQKVRYLSRKRLAEQRPRVKGQFVRQVHNNNHPVADVDGGS
ncbi:hypothetical protein QN277_022162 [Acacia crassicarpa]|uniref:Uncharacterized protein n=1 Tax=Acacia crassicarpa TaxID=499986 RepID=A0AAE1JHU3_9FABA|nr:hypothetical protein QN277_022162 [Acacia crassicarpa]